MSGSFEELRGDLAALCVLLIDVQLQAKQVQSELKALEVETRSEAVPKWVQNPKTQA